MAYTLKVRDETGTREVFSLDADDIKDANEQAREEITDWVSDGEWGDEGATVRAYWTLVDADGDVVDEGSVDVEIEPNHAALIRAAGGKPDCDDGDGHDWTSQGEGGLDENPGVWSVGGTAMVFRTHCTKCGLERREHSTGSQRNPGEHDTVSYAMPEPTEDDD